LKLDGKRLVAKPMEEESLCLDEWIAARGNNTFPAGQRILRAFVTRSKAVLQPSQMVLPITKNAHHPQSVRPRELG
jgi:hypothetical protein